MRLLCLRVAIGIGLVTANNVFSGSEIE